MKKWPLAKRETAALEYNQSVTPFAEISALARTRGPDDHEAILLRRSVSPWCSCTGDVRAGARGLPRAGAAYTTTSGARRGDHRRQGNGGCERSCPRLGDPENLWGARRPL